QAFNSRSRAFGIGSSPNPAIQTITPSVTTHNAPLIHNSSLNIGLMVILGFTALAMSRLVFAGVVARLAGGQVNDRGREWVSECRRCDGEHGFQEPPRRVVEDLRSHSGLRLHRRLGVS